MVTVFAFGSNMDPVQMRARCPSAKFSGTAELPGHRLVFVGHSNKWGGAVATVEPCEGRTVPGVLWRITEEDLARLDRFEGAPHVYEQRIGRVRGKAIVLYVHKRPVRGMPSASYVSTIRAGYQSAGLDETHLDSAVRRAQREKKKRAGASSMQLELRACAA
jgi:gamma-glutamylcyclotransferase (GGCT)/AIG2-like uncharacterized protein YtfP